MRITTLLLVFLAACGFDRIPAVGSGPPADPARSTVTVDRATGVIADGMDQVSITVTLLDSAGNPLVGRDVVLDATGSIASNLLTQPVAPTDISGVATGMLRSTVADAKQIAATADPGTNAVALAQQPTVQFIAGPAAALAFVVAPADTIAGAPIPVQVAVEDATGNVVTSATPSIGLAFATNPDGGSLAGTTTVPAVAGVATFSDLAVDLPGAYALRASSDGVVAATSITLLRSGGPRRYSSWRSRRRGRACRRR